MKTIKDIIDKFQTEFFVKDGTIPTETYVRVEAFLKDSLTSMLDGIEKNVKENSPAYDGEALDTNNNRRWYEQGFGENKQEVINIINSHR